MCQVKEGHETPMFCRDGDVAPGANRFLEREANIFAAELLMPEELVRAQWSRAASAAELASLFSVSEEAIGWRLYNLRLTPRPVS